jgi:tRNA1Val (adenine37-N6)-methyltransferase
MSNTYFQFKQFTIHQERCAMKVCTDACLFGAWVSEKVGSWQLTVGSILDIGTGTGLLSLMLAQKTNAHIDSIELDEHAAEQAAENFEASSWKERLQVITGDARILHLGKKYDLIISNPPFFEHDLKSTDVQRNLALHSEELSLAELLAVIKKNISEHGKFAVLLPYHRKDAFEKLAVTEGFFLEEAVSVKQTPNHAYFRVMFLFSTAEVPVKRSDLIIREEDQYTPEFSALLKDYYLKL